MPREKLLQYLAGLGPGLRPNEAPGATSLEATDFLYACFPTSMCGAVLGSESFWASAHQLCARIEWCFPFTAIAPNFRSPAWSSTFNHMQVWIAR